MCTQCHVQIRDAARAFKRAKSPTRTCPQCRGSGEYHGRGIIENGVFKGFVGPCFACHGRGTQTLDDVKRCVSYWMHNARVHA